MPRDVQPYSSLCCTFRYVLRTQPPGESEWTPDFREKFIEGFKVFLSLLSMMEVSVGVWNLRCWLRSAELHYCTVPMTTGRLDMIPNPLSGGSVLWESSGGTALWESLGGTVLWESSGGGRVASNEYKKL